LLDEVTETTALLVVDPQVTNFLDNTEAPPGKEDITTGATDPLVTVFLNLAEVPLMTEAAITKGTSAFKPPTTIETPGFQGPPTGHLRLTQSLTSEDPPIRIQASIATKINQLPLLTTIKTTFNPGVLKPYAGLVRTIRLILHLPLVAIDAPNVLTQKEIPPSFQNPVTTPLPG
ncbi:hypothetical protein AMTR_s00001p00268500, partial [Amborella trichopoda]